MLLKKSDILNADDSTFELVNVPEWGGVVKVTVMSGFARDRFESSIIGKNGGINSVNIRAKLAAATIVDEDGNLMFDEKDITKLGTKSCAALDRIFSAAQRLNLITDKDVENLAKN